LTVIDLLDALAEESREALKGFCLRSAKGNEIPLNIYTQNLPLKEEKNDEKLYPYVCVCYESSDIENAHEGKELADIYFVVGIIDKEKDNQGFRDVLQILERLKQHFFRKGIIKGAFRLEYPVKTMLQDEDTYPYFMGGIQAKCELFIITEEDEWI